MTRVRRRKKADLGFWNVDMPGIRVHERASIEVHTHGGWRLHWLKQGKEADSGKPKAQMATTFHANIVQISNAVLDRLGGDCTTVEEILKLYGEASAIVAADIENIIPATKQEG
ncbi:MAG: hypothetical protein KAJ73_00240 [Zetaproteobacteria bacterium]|nr:hypothetical protein [Zetaproteobacteria bacterium]